MADDEEKASPWRSTRVVLETGGWWEVLDADLPHFVSHARAYIASQKTHPEARVRVKAVWIDHQIRAPWRKMGPPPPPRLGGKRLAQTASAVIDTATGEVVEEAEAPF